MFINFFKEKSLTFLRKKTLLFFLIITLFTNVIQVQASSCDNVATLPQDFNLLLPQNEKLKRIHLSEFFFLDDNPGEDGGNTNADTKVASNMIKFNIQEKSVFKIQVTPQHVGLEVRIKINSKENILETSAGIPLDFTAYTPLEKGIIEVYFTVTNNEDEDVLSQMNQRTSIDRICDVPFMQLDIYLEEYQHLKERLTHVRKETEKLNEFDLSFSEALDNLVEKSNLPPDMRVKRFKTDLEAFKLTLPKSNGLQFYRKFNISVINEYDLKVPEEELKVNSTQTHTVNKFFLKMQMYSDFFLSGGLYFIIVRTQELESLQNFDCLYDTRCFLSTRPSKNAMMLETILTPGDYKILLVNISDKDVRKELKIDSIPVSHLLKIKLFQKAENRFNCEGRHLPHSFDYLMNQDDEDYFEYKGDVVMDMNKLYDEVHFNLEEDSVLRLVTFYQQGNKVDIELYEVNDEDEMKKLFSHRTKESNAITNLLKSAIGSKQKSKIVSTSKSHGESDGLLYQLKKGIDYKLIFNYKNSFFNEIQRKTCEMFYLKLVIAQQNFVKKIQTNQCNDKFEDLDKLLTNLEQNQSQQEYTYTTKNSIKVTYKSGMDNLILYKEKFEITQNMNIHLEVISDFVTSYIVPIIIPLKANMNINDILHHKHKKLTLHENTLKLKLNKGKYMLVLVNGISNLSDDSNPIHNISFKCMSFRLKVSTIRLDNRKMLNWECNYVHYDEIPNDLNLYLKERENFVYFNKNLLLPGNMPYKTMKLVTREQGYFIRLIAEYKDKNNMNKRNLDITLNKNGKVIRKAKEYVVDNELNTNAIYINYYLQPNSQFEIIFENLNNDKGWSYFEYCRTFKLEINLMREDFLKLRKQTNKCEVNTPKLEDVIYERLIDVDNSFYKYGTKSPIQMFSSVATAQNANRDSTVEDLQIVHPKGSRFVFKFNPENLNSQLKNTFTYNFEVKSYLAKATILIENSSIVGVSAKLRALNEKTSELISIDDLEEQNLYTARGVLLQAGKYSITFYVNTHNDKNYSEFIQNQCVSFAASVLIENKPFDFSAKTFGENYESCPYLKFPENMNIPGWIHADTDYTINEFLYFKLRNENRVKRFTLIERSIFKLHFPNEADNNLFAYISLSKITSNKKQKLVEKIEKSSNFINTVLEKGSYQLDFIFTGVSDSPINESIKSCHFYTAYLAIIPISNIIGGIDSFNPYQRNYCDERGISNNQLKPNSFVEHQTLRLSNIQEKLSEDMNKSEPPSNAKKIRLLPAENRGKFSAELISNFYTDVLYKFIVYKVNDNQLTKVPVELIKFENFVWASFHFEKLTEYLLEIKTANFDNYSVCSDVIFSYNYEEWYSYLGNNQNNTENEYMNKKDTCHIEDHLPQNLFTNTNNILDKYGGPQSETTGEINFYGEFLLNKSSSEIRFEFLIRQKSAVFVKIVPKYSHAQTNNIFLQVYRDKRMIYRFSHSEQGGLIILELDTYTDYTHNERVNEGVSPYFLEINFDKTLTNCESFDFIFSIVPKNVYLQEYLACDGQKDKLPDSLSFDKTSQFSFVTYLSQDDNLFTKDEVGNLYKLIRIDLSKATTLTILLEYILSDNMMDILIYHDPNYKDEKYDNNYIELGSESFHLAPNLNGVSSKKEINLNLKKGHFILKIVFHGYFLDILKKAFTKDSAEVCFGFNLDIEGVVLRNMKSDSKGEKEDDEYDPSLTHLSKSDFSGNYQNVIVSIDPPEMKSIKLDTLIEVEVKFAYKLEIDYTNHSIEKLMKLIYLQDALNSNDQKIYPKSIVDILDYKIIFSFEIIKKNFDLMKCYRLYLHSEFKEKYDSDAIESINHNYCTVNCDCLVTSSYKCSKKGTCNCHHPYTGSKCELCVEGFTMNKLGKCVDTKLSEVNCDDKFTCSGHGKCKTTKFDAYGATQDNRDGPCKCLDNYSSYNSPPGYPSTAFCNTCTNPIRIFPYCTEKNGMDSQDSIDFNFDTNCKESEGAISLPSTLYDNSHTSESDSFINSILEAFGGGQEADGSLDMLAILKVKESEEMTEIFIPEESIIRVFYESHEVNRAKILIFDGKHDTQAIAYTEGTERSESFIARLDAKVSSPYYMKIMHTNLKFGCNRYRLKIIIRPMKLVLADLKCKPQVNFANKDTLLPASIITFDATKLFGSETTYIIPDYLILDPTANYIKGKKNRFIDYTIPGVLSKANIDEEFIYNIKLEVKSAMTFSANALFDFLTSDLNIILRDSKGKVLKSGEWLIPDANFHTSDNDFINGVRSILDPGTYFLTIIQNVPANHLMQIITETELVNKSKHINRCFKFALHIQTTIINKPDESLSTVKFESMYNRIIDVEPDSLSSINVAKKFEIFVTFEDTISSTLKTDQENLSFRDVFYMENLRTKEKIPASHVYLQGALSKTFLILYDENVLIKDECYELKYNLDLIQSSNDKDRRITSDSPIVHKFCTKKCNCNPHTNFECDSQGKCQCEEPYTGEGCYKCIADWFYTRGKCISQGNCDKNFCSGFGKCQKQTSNDPKRLPQCKCNNFYTGQDCSKCVDENDIYPDCIKLEVVSKDTTPEVEYEKFLSVDKNEVTESDIETNRCVHSFIPHNLDSLGYLHLDGNMHMSGKYSLKHFNQKYYSMVFTIKERSHVKLFVEHSKSTHIISLFLVDDTKKLIHSGGIHVGPSGVGSSAFLDFVIDPIIDKTNQYGQYTINFFIKDIPAGDNDTVISYHEEADLTNLMSECFTVFLEMQVMTQTKEKNMIEMINKEDTCRNKKENPPILIPSDASIVDYHNVFYNSVDMRKTFTHIREDKLLNDINYFHYEYFYVPDHLDYELILEIEVLSKFINSQIGVLLEIVEIPIRDLKVDHRKLNAKMIADVVEHGNKLRYPECSIHCFSGIKKFNSALLSRILPSDTFFRIWFYDLSPKPKIVHSDQDTLSNTCLNFEVNMNLKNVKSDVKSLKMRQKSSLCLVTELPKTLNQKGFLGDKRYLEKWGFHILDSFRVDHVIGSGLVHETHFEINEYHLFRMVVFHGKVDTDLELYFIDNNKEEILISRSNSKNFEDAIVIEIPPGKYKILFKFFPGPNGFNKCESIKMEFSMNSFHVLQENIDRMVARHKNNPIFLKKVDLFDNLTNNNGKNMFDKETISNRYTLELKEAFKINIDDTKNYEPSVSLAEMTFVIEPEDSGKLELISFVNSDFLYLDANVYLSFLPSKDNKEAKIISGNHKKNMNLLFTGPLESGTYILSVRYYRRLHYKNPNDSSLKDVQLFRANFGEIEFDAMLMSKSKEEISILTSFGYFKVIPFNLNKTSISHNWLCRHSALPLPNNLSNLRYLEFKSDVHILDNFLVPAMGLGEKVIKLRLRYSPNTMIRVYVECNTVDIDLELREVVSFGRYNVLAQSQDNVHFETIMQIISDDKDYEIVLKFKGKSESEENFTNMSFSDPSQSCSTFKLEIALEKSHNYACPDTNKYSELTTLKPIPDILPHNKKYYKYDSREIFKGDENDSGYVYMLRSETDKVVRFTQFEVVSEIDMKIEIINDFMQAPVNIILTSTNQDFITEKTEGHKLASNLLGLTNAFVVAYGEIFENRTVLLTKNLPVGVYTAYLYLPGLVTKFTNEPRVCSIYDIIVEVKKSRYHFKEKEIINTAAILDENLDLPVHVPITLNNLKYLGSEENYINYSGEFYMRNNSTSIDLYNSVTFNIKEESVVEFLVASDHFKDLIQVAIEGHSHFNYFTNAVLKPGNYLATIKIDKFNSNQIDLNSINNLIQFYIGVAPIKRVEDIYKYNNLLSTYHQCTSMKLPQALEYEEATHTFHYHNDFFTYNKKNLNNLKIGQFTVVLKSNNNRIIVEIGTDYVLNKISVVVKSENRQWRTSYLDNQGELDIIVPAGSYLFEVEVESQIILPNLDCLLFSLDIHIIDNDFIDSDLTHPLSNSRVFDSSHKNSKSKLLAAKCDGSVLPLVLHRGSPSEYHNIKENGDYLLHINKASYFLDNRKGQNMNEVDINLHMKSIVRIVTTVDRPNEFQILPKMKYFKKNQKSEGNYYLNSDIQFVTHNLKERNAVWFLDSNSQATDEFYQLEFVQERYEEMNETSLSFQCPYYSLDILIQSVSELANRMKCIQPKEGELLEYILPNKDLPIFKIGANAKSHHEKLEFSYMTEKQYSDNYVQSDQFSGLQYVINFEVEEGGEFHLNLQLGYDQVISSFEVYLSKVEENDVYKNKLIQSSFAYFDKYDDHFPYKRLLNANVTKGKYVLILVDNLWNDIIKNVKVRANAENVTMCLPFNYSLDIIPANEKSVLAEIISIFPPGPIAFKSHSEDLNIKVTLSKPAFTKNHEPITYSHNIMNIVNAFYLSKVAIKGEEGLNDVGPINKIHPIKIDGAENNKEWNLLFMKELFDAGFDYELRLDNTWLYDVNYSQFRINKKMPIIRVETKKEAIFEFVDNINQMREKMKESELKNVKDDSKINNIKEEDNKNKNSSKCGEHGKLIYDNIMKKQVCTCYDGFSGKLCQDCYGVYDKISNKCVDKEEDEDEDNVDFIRQEAISESITKHITSSNTDTDYNKPTFVPPQNEFKSCEGGCVNGFCDSKIGRCVCDVAYTGVKCDKKKIQDKDSSSTNTTIHDGNYFIETLFKLM